jgi:hypothetical protein
MTSEPKFIIFLQKLSCHIEKNKYQLKELKIKLNLKRVFEIKKFKLKNSSHSISPRLQSIIYSQKKLKIIEWISNYIKLLLEFYAINKYGIDITINESKLEVILKEYGKSKITYKYIDFMCGKEIIKKIIDKTHANESKIFFFFSKTSLELSLKNWIIEKQGFFLYIDYNNESHEISGKIHYKNNSVGFSLESFQPRELIDYSNNSSNLSYNQLTLDIKDY